VDMAWSWGSDAVTDGAESVGTRSFDCAGKDVNDEAELSQLMYAMKLIHAYSEATN
jgi:hypothetical protein